MKILVCGVGKSGTTALTYKVAGGLDGPEILFEPDGPREPDRETAKHLVVKRLVYSSAGEPMPSLRYIDDYADFDSRIWIARDPRDVVISGFLYQWHVAKRPSAIQFEQARTLLRQKEAESSSVPFHRLMRIRGDATWSVETLRHIQADAHRVLRDFVKTRSGDWHVVRYEDMVLNRVSRLERDLGFPLPRDAEVPHELRRVDRSRTGGHWRTWFAEEDVSFFRDLHSDYLDCLGYRADDWQLMTGSIDPAMSSRYMEQLYAGDLG